MQKAVLTADIHIPRQSGGQLEEGTEVEVEGLWHEITGKSWMFSEGNPACLIYAMRSGFADLPTDNKVYYIKADDGLGRLVHESELAFI